MPNERPQWTIDHALTLVEREWRRRHVDPRDRAALREDLRLDLEAAQSEGIRPDELIKGDVRDFAARLADEAGARRIPFAYRRLLLNALIGTLPGALLGYWMLYGVHMPIVGATSRQPTVAELAGFYSALGALVLAGSLLTVWLRMRDLPAMGRTVLGMALAMPVTALAAIPVAMLFAWSVNYSSAFPVLVVEASLVCGPLAGAVVVVRRWALRDYDAPAPHRLHPAPA